MDEKFLNLILDERKRQDEKWGVQDHTPFKWVAILAEEFGEVAKAAYEKKPDEYLTEIVQVAAVSMAMYESYERNKVIE
jgi:NTP pyrophosphatase (non-canonical NTP hydrolase)